MMMVILKKANQPFGLGMVSIELSWGWGGGQGSYFCGEVLQSHVYIAFWVNLNINKKNCWLSKFKTEYKVTLQEQFH